MEHDFNGVPPALLPRLRRFALALTGSAADADDLVQAACERVLARRGQLRSDSEIAAWMYRIMRNMLTDEIRDRRPRDGMAAAESAIGEAGEEIVENMRLAAVRRALADLPESQRTVLVLVCVDGLSYKETAEILGIPLGMVTSRVAQAREALRERMIGQSRRGTLNEGSPIALVATIAPLAPVGSIGPAVPVVLLHPAAAGGEQS